MGFSKQGYLNAFPFPSPGDLPNVGMEPGSPTLQADALPSEPPGKHQPFTQIGNIWVDPDLSFPLPFFSLLSWHQPEIPLTLPLWYFSFISFLSGWLAPSFPPCPLSWCHTESSRLWSLCRFLIACILPHLVFSAAHQQHPLPTESPCSPAARSQPSVVWLQLSYLCFIPPLPAEPE